MPDIGSTLGDFLLESVLGRGGMGVVFLARQRSLGRRVALKVLPKELTTDPMYVGRFKREAEAISRLDHSNIVPVIAVGEQDGDHYIAMKFVGGPTLDQLVRARASGRPVALVSSEPTLVLERPEREGVAASPRRPHEAPPTRPAPRTAPAEGRGAADAAWRERCVVIVEKIASALSHAHAHGIVHRDVKPGNIVVDCLGEPWLLDFGLVRDLSNDRTFCDGRTVLGTAQYMPPEQVRGLRRQTDQRSDVYSLGVTLYELLTLTRPFDDRDTTAILHAVISEEPPAPRAVVPEIPIDLETVVLKAMAKRPEERYPTADAFAADLRRFRNSEPIAASRAGFRRFMRRMRNASSLATAACLLAFAGVAGVAGVTVMQGDRDASRLRDVRTEADSAYARGDLALAAEHYGVFVRLGGSSSEVADRVRECRARSEAARAPATAR